MRVLRYAPVFMPLMATLSSLGVEPAVREHPIRPLTKTAVVEPKVADVATEKNAPLKRLTYSPDGEHLVAASENGMVYVWDRANRKLRYQSRGVHKLQDLRISHDGWLLAMVGEHGRFRIVELPTGRILLESAEHFEGRIDSVNQCVSLSPAQGRLAVGRNHELYVFDALGGKEQFKLRPYGFGAMVRDVAFSPDGRLLASLKEHSVPGSIELWDADSGKLVKKLAVPLLQKRPSLPPKYEQLLWSPDGFTVAALSRGAWHFWDVQRGEYDAHFTLAGTFCFSPDGKWLGHVEELELVLYELATGRRCLAIPFPANGAHPPNEDNTPRRTQATTYTSLAIASDLKTVALATVAGPEIVFWPLTPPMPDVSEDKSLAVLWEELAGEDASLGYQAVWQLAAREERALQFFTGRLLPVTSDEGPVAEHRKIEPSPKEQGDGRPETQHKTVKKWMLIDGKLIPYSEKAAIEGRPRSHKVQGRESSDLDKQPHPPTTDPEQLRRHRAVQTLEMLGTSGAARYLAKLASGWPTARLTLDARAALARLSARGIDPGADVEKN